MDRGMSDAESRIHLPIVGQDQSQAPGSEPAPRRRHPAWIRATLPSKPAYFELRAMIKELALHTV